VADSRTSVVLVAVDRVLLDDLVEVATTRASADEVTPPLTPGPEWSPVRVAWLRSFHRDRRQGLDGPAGEATWAVIVGRHVVGSVRLKRIDEDGVLETGMWLARDTRGRGIGTAALAAVLQQASGLGASAVRADTTAGNTGAVGALRRLGFTLNRGEGQTVRAVVSLAPQRPDTGHR
jgi:RimJ/RimL family protein N-acetyltransferase